MSSRLLLACAVGLAACAPASAPEAPAAAPAAAAAAAVPLSPERERFERFKQSGAAGDPRAEFARRAEAEAERLRSEALARGVGPAAGGVEAELLEEQLAQLGTGGAGCFEEEPDLTLQEDWIRHRGLTRDDFRGQQKSDDAKPVVPIPGGEAGAYVSVGLACVVKGNLSEPQFGRFVVEVEHVKYLALMSRRLSWWNPNLGEDRWVLRHEQLHFDLAELIAHELDGRAGEVRERVRGTGPDPQAAIADFRARWAEHMREQREAFRTIELTYDRETRHGNDRARQTEWFARVKRGLGAVRAGLDAAPVPTP